MTNGFASMLNCSSCSTTPFTRTCVACARQSKFGTPLARRTMKKLWPLPNHSHHFPIRHEQRRGTVSVCFIRNTRATKTDTGG